MSSTPSTSAIASFSKQFNLYMPIPTFIFGVVGNMFNIIVFTRPSLRKNPCTTYFCSSSVANLNVLVFGLVVRVIMDGFGYDLGSSNIIFCRIRYLILHCSIALSSWFYILAGVDRYCLSSRDANRRQFSTLKHARILVALATCICFLLYAHVLGLFEIEQLKSGPYCYARAGTYRLFYDFMRFATFSFTPPILMTIVGLATIHNIRQARKQVVPISVAGTTATSTNIIQMRKRDRQLITMLLIQSISIAVCTLPLATQKLYSTFTQNVAKDAYQLAIEDLVTQILRQLTFINSATCFYV